MLDGLLGARFLLPAETFQARKAKAKSRTLRLQSCVIHIFLIHVWTRFPSCKKFQAYTLLRFQLHWDERKLALRARKVSGAVENRPPVTQTRYFLSSAFCRYRFLFYLQTRFVVVFVFWKVKPNVFKFDVCNPCQQSPSLTILVPLWFIIVPLLFFFILVKYYVQVSFNSKVVFYVAKITQIPWLTPF